MTNNPESQNPKSKIQNRPRRSPYTDASGSADVRRMVQDAQERQATKITKGRGRAGHGGELGRDASGRTKVTVEMSLARQAEMREMAEKEDVFPADIISLAMARLYRDWQAGEVDLFEMKIPSRTPRVMWRLDETQFFS